MRSVVISREVILTASRTMLREKGWAAINMRSVAAQCGVAVGSLYNYFSSKTELVAATVESVWEEIFRLPTDFPGEERFCRVWTDTVVVSFFSVAGRYASASLNSRLSCS